MEESTENTVESQSLDWTKNLTETEGGLWDFLSDSILSY